MAMGDAIGPPLAQAVGAQLDDAARYLAWRGGRVHAGVHEARKSLRRVRAVLTLVAPCLGSEAGHAGRALAGIGRGLSALRDSMACVEALDRLLGRAGADGVLLRRCRRAATAARAAAAREVLTADPDLASLRAHLRQVHAQILALPWASLCADDVNRALAHATARAHRAHARASRRGRDADWHRWRRRVRLLVHARAVLAEAGVAVEPDPEDTLRLAAALGRAQDLVLLKRQCADGKVFARADRKPLKRLLVLRLKRSRGRVERYVSDIAARTGAS